MFRISLALMVVVLGVGTAFGNWMDGGTHDITTVYPSYYLISAGTTVNVLAGGSIAASEHINVRNDSFLNVYSGGTVGVLNVTNNSTVTLSGGTATRINLTTGSQATIHSGSVPTGGSTATSLSAQGDASVTVYGGTFDGTVSILAIDGEPAPTANLMGGTFGGGAHATGGTMVIDGASFGGSSSFSNANVSIYSGSFLNEQYKWNSITGGTVTVYGSDFNYDYGQWTGNWDTITGKDAYGNPFAFKVGSNDASRQLYLVEYYAVPEPASIALLGVGVAAFVRRRRQVA
jgi:hypothetical protein